MLCDDNLPYHFEVTRAQNFWLKHILLLYYWAGDVAHVEAKGVISTIKGQFIKWSPNMSCIETLEDLPEDNLKDLYSAEKHGCR